MPGGVLHLNAANAWTAFQLDGLDVTADGTLQLSLMGGQLGVRGAFLGGPFETPEARPTPWFRLEALADPLPSGAHLQLFTFTADGGTAPFSPGTDDPFGDPGWAAAPRDALDLLIPNAPARSLWVGGLLRGDGSATPALRQLRVAFGRETYLRHLPAIYGADPAGRELTERLLALPASVLGGLERAIDDLPRLFDADAAPAGDPPSWLHWLAGWLAFAPSESWSEADTRRHVAGAFDLAGRRGTVDGLRRYLRVYAGVEAHIDEPGLRTTLWALGETSTLGLTTALAPAALQGAVLGTSATLDQSHLTRGDDLGAALFEDVAHRFCVAVYCAELRRPGVLDAVRAVIEREKPAHTTCHLRVIEPRLRVGVQARVGLDAIVGQAAPAVQVGGTRLGHATLAADATPCEPGEES
jgi:phage tail-like protein